jgi:hypothetical protein
MKTVWVDRAARTMRFLNNQEEPENFDTEVKVEGAYFQIKVDAKSFQWLNSDILTLKFNRLSSGYVSSLPNVLFNSKPASYRYDRRQNFIGP